MNFEQKAQEIIRTSIKSAIFIDEKARTFFQDSSDLKGENEELKGELEEAILRRQIRSP